MKELITFYKSTLGWLAAAVVAVVLLVPRVAVPFLISTYGRTHWSVTTANFVASRGFAVGVLVAGEWLIRKWLWKIVHPELNFSGKWTGRSSYEVAQIGGRADLPPDASHEIVFEQDAISFDMAPTDSDEYASWGAHAITLVDRHTVKYAYWVKYANKKPLFPERAIGYEELKVVDRGRRGRPIEMKGDFYHCAMGLSPVYSGSVRFERA